MSLFIIQVLQLKMKLVYLLAHLGGLGLCLPRVDVCVAVKTS